MKRMETNLGGHGVSSFRDIAPFCLQKWPRFPFEPWTIVHGDQKIHASRGCYEMLAN